MTWQPGDRVRMTDAYKRRMLGNCVPGSHVPPLPGEPPLEDDMPDQGCMHCSTGHIEEFGNSIGIVQGLRDYNNVKPGRLGYDPNKVGPEYEVRWLPGNLRYGYYPDDLERAP